MAAQDRGAHAGSGVSDISAEWKSMPQYLLAALFAVAISFLTFAASLAEVPRSEYVPATLSVD